MGSYVSRYECEAHHNITLNCTIAYTDSTNTSLFAIGDIEKGGFEGDPDIAGVGIFATFLAVSGLALLSSISDLLWRFAKWIQERRKRKRDSKPKHSSRTRSVGAPDFFEAVVVSCSDTQVFTGAAYAITLRYFRGCTITAYHYNMVANMMLLTCATHLMSITVVKNYWKYPWLALVRVLAITGVFLVTGMLLANQNADISDLQFPTELPRRNETDSLLFMHAACFQSPDAQLIGTLNSSFATAEGFGDAILNSKPGNKIAGWDKFLVMLLWYGAALVVEVFCFFRRGAKRGGRRSQVTRGVTRAIHSFMRTFFPCCIRREKRREVSVEYTPLSSPTPFESKQLVSPQPLGSTRGSIISGVPTYQAPDQSQHEESIDINKEEILLFTWLHKSGKFIHAFYMVGGAGICSWTVVMSASYMSRLRYWVLRSGWLISDDQGVMTEEDPTTFGQLVPICMSGLILFSVVETLSRFITQRKDQKYYHTVSQSPEEGNNRIYRPSMGTISEAFESTRPQSTRPELRYSKVHSSSISSPGMGFSPDTPTPFSKHSTLLALGSEVATPQPTASSSSELGAVVPERMETPQSGVSLGEIVLEAAPSRVSTPSVAGGGSGVSTPRPSSTVPVQMDISDPPGSLLVGEALLTDEPPRTPSPLTPSSPPPAPTSTPPAKPQ